MQIVSTVAILGSYLACHLNSVVNSTVPHNAETFHPSLRINMLTRIISLFVQEGHV